MILDYPLLVFVMSFIVLVLSAKTGDGLRMKVRRLREDGGTDFGVVLTGTLTLTLPIGLALATVCYSQGKPQGRPDGLIAVVAGQPIYEQDLMSVAGPSLLDLHKQEYKLKIDSQEARRGGREKERPEHRRAAKEGSRFEDS